jgi:hypothetical protein
MVTTASSNNAHTQPPVIVPSALFAYINILVRIFIFAYRKPSLSPGEFKEYYEAHVDLLKRL